MSKIIKTRFCPSPTGRIHLGNVRTALFNDLYAEKMHGCFLLRIEDTDPSRSTEAYAQHLQTDLQWLGLQWHEGPTIGGEHGPYWQSQRQSIYDHYYQRLVEKQLAYPCFCSDQQLALMRKVQRASGKPPRYAGTCRQLTPEQVQEKLAAGLKPTLRFRIPRQTMIEFHDHVKGLQRFNSDDIGDFIIRRADGSAPFMYCNAVDDALMGVTHVIRGEDHLTNTPRQVLIFQALGFPIPEYAHISLILANDGSPLSKRHGSRNIEELRTMGFLPKAINNYLARLGHYYASNELMTLTELANGFELTQLSGAPARFDYEQLLYWQKQALAELEPEAFWTWLEAHMDVELEATDRLLFIDAVRSNIAFPHEGVKWAKILLSETLVLSEVHLPSLKMAPPDFFHAALSAVELHGLDYTAIVHVLKTSLNVKGKPLFLPLRVALTGEEHGPEMAKILPLIGMKQVRQRLQQASDLCCKSTTA